jgi:transcriptional regulator with XRE-family HTH domain
MTIVIVERSLLVGRNLKKFREERKLSQAQLGDLTGFPANTLATWEQGHREPRSANLAVIADALGRSMDDFFMETPPPPRDVAAKAFALKVVGEDVDEQLRQKGERMVRELNQAHLENIEAKKRQISAPASTKAPPQPPKGRPIPPGTRLREQKRSESTQRDRHTKPGR